MSKRMIDMAFVTAVNTPAEFSAYLRTDIQKWGKVIKEAGIQVQ